MAVIARAVLAQVDGIAMPGTEIACVVVAAFASTAANQAFPFASARRIGIVITTGDVTTAMATGATVDRRRERARHPAPFFLAMPPAGAVAFVVRLRSARPTPLS
jgi:hypothetical protein